MKKLTLVLLLGLFVTSAKAVTLTVVTVGAPAINCVFDPGCTAMVNDTTAPIPLTGTTGSGFLQSRSLRGSPDSRAVGLYIYQYRVDLRNAAGVTNIDCVTSVTLNFGPVVSTLDFNGDGTSDQVFVVTSGGVGSIGVASADKVGSHITFNFGSPVCAGRSPGAGQSSFFWGLVSSREPRFVSANVTRTSGSALNVEARAPRYVRIRHGSRRG